MCVSPNDVDGQMVACRKCYQCRKLRAKDWEGRCLAERETSASAYFVTLTFAPNADGTDPMYAHYLFPKPMQDFFKQYRYYYKQIRYLAVGEYGSLKGRAHWHAILFCEKRVNQKEMQSRIEECWTHGIVDVKRLSHKRIKYAVKYLTKDEADKNKNIRTLMSRKPAIGAEFFERRAREMVKQGIPLVDTLYEFPDVLDRDGKRIKYFLANASADAFKCAYVKEWLKQRPSESLPTDFVADYYENSGKFAIADPALAESVLDNFKLTPFMRYPEKPLVTPSGRDPGWCNKRKLWYIAVGQHRFYFRKENGKWQDAQGMVLHSADVPRKAR